MVALADQSVFVRASIQGVVREALIAAALTGLMILLFLGSWRSTLIVCISIPLSILDVALHAEPAGPDHQRDDAGRPGAGGRHPGGRRHGRDREHASQPRACASRWSARCSMARRRSPFPTFVATLSICIVFVPVLLLTGTARYLFTPLAMAVVFAMLASYLLSRTLVPTMVALSAEIGSAPVPAGRRRRDARRQGHLLARPLPVQPRVRASALPLHGPARLVAAPSRAGVLPAFLAFSPSARSGWLWLVGEDFFPNVDSGQMRLHARGPAGTRIEETEVRFAAIEREIRDRHPAGRDRHD